MVIWTRVVILAFCAQMATADVKECIWPAPLPICQCTLVAFLLDMVSSSVQHVFLLCARCAEAGFPKPWWREGERKETEVGHAMSLVDVAHCTRRLHTCRWRISSSLRGRFDTLLASPVPSLVIVALAHLLLLTCFASPHSSLDLQVQANGPVQACPEGSLSPVVRRSSFIRCEADSDLDAATRLERDVHQRDFQEAERAHTVRVCACPCSSAGSCALRRVILVCLCVVRLASCVLCLCVYPVSYTHLRAHETEADL
eukprot:1913270-Rhodomonas_salina.3